QAGYLSYVGNAGELWRLVHEGCEQKKYSFQYYDGEEAGILESTACRRKMFLDTLLFLSLSEKIALLLTEIRKEKGRSLDSLAKQINVSKGFLEHVEGNHISITIDTLEMLLQALKIDQKTFFQRLSDK
ncbi:helix-turn-helix domain-containing protein, partial [Vibrio vulnificus]|uniref:helix-turn-helix domain-containing protein n=1 Tax=Vibrio vulnificus TaxID=672 RepID=UPI00051D517B